MLIHSEYCIHPWNRKYFNYKFSEPLLDCFYEKCSQLEQKANLPAHSVRMRICSLADVMIAFVLCSLPRTPEKFKTEKKTFPFLFDSFVSVLFRFCWNCTCVFDVPKWLVFRMHGLLCTVLSCYFHFLYAYGHTLAVDTAQKFLRKPVISPLVNFVCFIQLLSKLFRSPDACETLFVRFGKLEIFLEKPLKLAFNISRLL